MSLKSRLPKPSSHSSTSWWSKPALLVLVAGLLVLSLSLFFSYKLRPFSSDDVATQVALSTWHPGHGELLYFTSDTWLLKVPLFALIGLLFGTSRHSLFFTCLILAVTTFGLFYLALLYFGRRSQPSWRWSRLLPFVWLCSSGFFFAKLLLNPNLRNIEIGISFMLFIFFAQVITDKIPFRTSRLWQVTSLLFSVLIGLTVYDDPMFLYFLVVPLGLFAVWMIGKTARRNSVFMLGFLFVSMLAYAATKFLGHAAGIRTYAQPMQFATFEHLFSQSALAIHSLLQVFNADFTGRAVMNLTTISRVLNFGVLTIVLYQVRHSLTTTKPDNKATDVWARFFAFLFTFIFAIYTVSSLATDLETFRYLVLLPFIGVALLVMRVGLLSRRVRIAIMGVLITASGLNLFLSYQAAHEPTPKLVNRANYQNIELIKVLQREHFTKGYGQYWDSHINSYLSNNTVSVAPIICIGDRTTWFNWLSRQNLIRGSNIAPTFMIRNTAPGMGVAIPTCDDASLNKQFGPYQRKIQVQDYTIFVYNYDIGTKITYSPLTYSK